MFVFNEGPDSSLRRMVCFDLNLTPLIPKELLVYQHILQFPGGSDTVVFPKEVLGEHFHICVQSLNVDNLLQFAVFLDVKDGQPPHFSPTSLSRAADMFSVVLSCLARLLILCVRLGLLSLILSRLI